MCWFSVSLGDGALAVDKSISLGRCTLGQSLHLRFLLLWVMVAWPLISHFLWG